jgi:cysteine-rich repeat protein
LNIAPPADSVDVGNTKTFRAFYDPDTAGPQPTIDVSSQAGWRSGNTSIASSQGGGSFRGESQGAANLYATYAPCTNSSGQLKQAEAALSVRGSANQLPIGFHDGNDNALCTASGWATDPDNRDTDLTIHIYSDGTRVKTDTASQFRSDLANGICPGGTCGFVSSLKGLITFGEPHDIEVRALDAQTGQEKRLEATPKSITCRSSITPTNGSCGTANGVSTLTAPSANLCSSGTPSQVIDAGKSWTWSCNGSNNGSNASCSAPKSQTGSIPSPAPNAVCSGSWGDTQPLGGFGKSEPVMENRGNQLIAVIQGGDDGVYANERRPNGSLTGWRWIQGHTNSRPKMIEDSSGDLWVYVTGIDGWIYRNKYNSEESWSGWQGTGVRNENFGSEGPNIVATQSEGTYRVIDKNAPKIEKCITSPGPVCGNGIVESPEQCEPPNTATCSATCQNITSIPPPIAAPFCSGSTSRATISWSPQTGTPRDDNGYWIDIDNDNNWGNGFWNKNMPQGSSSTEAPTGFGPFGGASGSLTLNGGITYQIRVFYATTSEHSPTASFAASSCQSGPVCGNGIVESPEQCDDSNTSNGDGCSSTCQNEGGGSIPSPAPNAVCSGSWGDTQPLGGFGKSEPVMENRGNQLIAVIQGGDDGVYANERRPNGSLTGWRWIQGHTNSRPKMIEDSSGDLWVYVTGIDGWIYRNKYNSEESWSGWQGTGVRNENFGSEGPNIVATQSEGTYRVIDKNAPKIEKCITSPGPVCGNGIVESPEQCDEGNNNGSCPASCSRDCAINSCAGSFDITSTQSFCPGPQTTVAWNRFEERGLNVSSYEVHWCSYDAGTSPCPLFPDIPDPEFFQGVSPNTNSFTHDVFPNKIYRYKVWVSGLRSGSPFLRNTAIREITTPSFCTPSCTDECAPIGARECVAPAFFRTCGKFDSDSCLEWGSPISCPAGQQCTSGSCIPIPKPDLVVSENPAPALSTTIVRGTSIRFRGTILNQGSAFASGQFQNRFRIDINNDGNSSNDVILAPAPVLRNLSSGSSEQVLSGFWVAVTGTHRIILCADFPPSPNGVVSEENETNNCSSSSGSAGVFVVRNPARVIEQPPE